jgi:hypothetical protein
MCNVVEAVGKGKLLTLPRWSDRRVGRQRSPESGDPRLVSNVTAAAQRKLDILGRYYYYCQPSGYRGPLLQPQAPGQALAAVLRYYLIPQ